MSLFLNPPIFLSWNWVCDSQSSILNYLCVNYYCLTLHVISKVLTHNTSQSLLIVAQKINNSRIFSSKCAYYKSFSEYRNFSWPKSDTPFIEPVVLGPFLSFVPNLQSLGGIPTTWLIDNLYFLRYPRLPQLGLLATLQPLLVSILALVSITSHQGGGPMDLRFFPNEQGSSSGHTHQPTS